MSRLALYLLGPPEIKLDGEPAHIGRSKAVALLAYLAATGTFHRRDALAALLWPDFDQSRARAELRRALSALNLALGKQWLATDRETAGLDDDAEIWLDVDEFRQRLAACKAHGHHRTETVCAECQTFLQEAVTLYRDDFMAGFSLADSLAFDEWQRFQAATLRDELAGALERLANYLGALGNYEDVIAHARLWLEMDLTHEPAHRRLMELYAQSGRHGAAARQYRTCVRVLDEELGVPPSAETTALYERIQAQRKLPTGQEGPGQIMPRGHAAPPAFLSDDDAAMPDETPIFVAREPELARLDAFLGSALAGQGRVVFISGGPGRGKTTLMREFARRATDTHPDLLVAGGTGVAYTGVGDPYLPFRDIIGLLTGDIQAGWSAGNFARENARRLWENVSAATQTLLQDGPELIGTFIPGDALLRRAAAAEPLAPWLSDLQQLAQRAAMRSADTGLPQSALFRQYINVLHGVATQKPLLLMLDDVQWADTGSISLLFQLGRGLADAPCPLLILVAYRPEEVAVDRGAERHPLLKVLAEFQRHFGDASLDLAQTEPTGGRGFVDAYLDTQPNQLDDVFRQTLAQRTGGHPLFTVELLQAMQERGDLLQGENGLWVAGRSLDWETLPARVEAVIAERVGRLEDELRDLLTIASVEGETFTARVVACVQDRPEREVLRSLSQELQTRHRLVTETAEVHVDGLFLSRFAFGHALFQSYLYDSLSSGERRLLHGEVGATLEALFGARGDSIAAQLAYHFSEAGHRTKAIDYAIRAGHQALLAFAYEEALGHYRRALRLLDATTAADADEQETAWRLETLRRMGQTLYWLRDLAEAEQRLREAITLGQETDAAPQTLVRLFWWLGEAVIYQDRIDEVLQIGEEGLQHVGTDTESVEAALMNQTIAASHLFSDNAETHREILLRIAQFIHRLPYAEELCPAYYQICGVIAFDQKNLETANEWLREFKERALRCHDIRAVTDLNELAGKILFQSGDTRSAITHLEETVDYARRLGSIGHEINCLNSIGPAFLRLGDLQTAEFNARRLLQIAGDIESSYFASMALCVEAVLGLCRSSWGDAADAFETIIESLGNSRRPHRVWALVSLGAVRLRQGRRREALKRYQEAITIAPITGAGFLQQYMMILEQRPPFMAALAGLEQAYDDPESFRDFCRRFREQNPEVVGWPFTQWCLKRAEPHDLSHGVVCDPFEEPLSAEWVWEDPFGDCTLVLRDGLEIHAANERDLWQINLSAPRLLRPAPQGDCAVQTVCSPASAQLPAIGGLLLWGDKENYLRLDAGIRGAREISLEGCLANQDVVIGRGRLRADNHTIEHVENTSDRVFLRMERIGATVRALCSADGDGWFTVREATFPIEGPLHVGLHAIGHIDRTIYHRAYPEGTAVRFESFELWELDR